MDLNLKNLLLEKRKWKRDKLGNIIKDEDNTNLKLKLRDKKEYEKDNFLKILILKSEIE
jgi:hypothetical protein